MLVVNRYRLEAHEVDDFWPQAEVALSALAERPGFVSGRAARSSDDPCLLAMVTEWESVGTYRRALSHPHVKMTAHPLMYRCIDEPGAYEVALEVVAGRVVSRPSDLSPDR